MLKGSIGVKQRQAGTGTGAGAPITESNTCRVRGGGLDGQAAECHMNCEQIWGTRGNDIHPKKANALRSITSGPQSSATALRWLGDRQPLLRVVVGGRAGLHKPRASVFQQFWGVR